MSTTNETLLPYKPTEEISAQDANEEPIAKAVETFNMADLEQLRLTLRERVEMSPNGVAYAIIGPQDRSKDEAIGIPTPFANTMTDNMLERGYFLSLVAENAGITDSEGKTLPIILLASPGIVGSKIKFTSEELSKIKSGELGVYAKELLRALQLMGVGRLALTGAFSQGADIALASHKHAPESDIDITKIAVGDPATTTDRGKIKLLNDFKATGTKALKQTIQESGLDHKMDSIDNIDFARFGLSAVLYSTNRALWAGLAHNKTEGYLNEILTSQQALDGILQSVIVAYGEDSAIANPAHIEPALQRATEQDLVHILHTIKVNNANHTWGDNLPLLSKLLLRAHQS